MNKKQKALIVSSLLLSPIVLGQIYSLSEPPTSVFGVMVVVAVTFGWPFILITGFIISSLTRKTQRATLYFILGYTVPTLIVLGWEFGILQSILP